MTIAAGWPPRVPEMRIQRARVPSPLLRVLPSEVSTLIRDGFEFPVEHCTVERLGPPDICGVQRAHGPGIRLNRQLGAVIPSCPPQAERDAGGIGEHSNTVIRAGTKRRQALAPRPLGMSQGFPDVYDTHVGEPPRRRLRRRLSDAGHQLTAEARSVVVAVETGRHRNGVVESPAEERTVEVPGRPGVGLPGIDPAGSTD